MSLMNECLVVNLQIGAWSGHRLDKAMTQKVTNDAGAHADAARVNKHLVPKEALAEIVTAMGAIRAYFYDKTLPWKDNGDRLLTRTAAQQFLVDYSELEQKFKNAVGSFLDEKYPAAIASAEFRMGDLFDLADYPTKEHLRRKFYTNIDIDAVAQAKDIRLNDNTEALQARVTKAMAGLWSKLAQPLQHFANVMSDDKAIFRDSTVSNLREIVEMIPALNFTGDQELERIRVEIEQRITQYDAKDLRKDKDVRSAIAGEAKAIMDEMAGFMNAFSNGSAE